MRMPAIPPALPELIRSQGPDISRLISSDAGQLPKDKYLHWSKLRYRKPPEGLSSEDWWLAIKLARLSARHVLPLEDKNGQSFAFTDSAYLNSMLHRVDRDAGGRIELPDDLVNVGSHDRYLVNSLIEEAIASSQLEGAVTTRRVAKEMLRSRRRPRDKSEQMIVNNYRGMEFLRDHTDDDLSLPLLLELHRILTEDTLEPDEVGRIRHPSENVTVVDQRDGTIVHEPPSACALDGRLVRLFKFANGRDEELFIHPVLRAVLLHFMIGYEHPFVDGNGRAARALFYWAMARSGYWMTEFLSISTIVRKAPTQYVSAYVFSEIDDNDVTYFLDYNLRVILRSISQLRDYLARKAREMRDIQQLLGGSRLASMLNYRQRALLAHMSRHPDASYTIESHRRSHNVTYQTARTDLMKLAELDLVEGAKRGRTFVFTGTRDFEERLRQFVSTGGG